MALDERYRSVIKTDAGIKDVVGRARVVAVGLDEGRVILGIAIDDGDGPVMDTRAWVSMPDDVADRLGYHLQSAAEVNRQRQRES